MIASGYQGDATFAATACRKVGGYRRRAAASSIRTRVAAVAGAGSGCK